MKVAALKNTDPWFSRMQQALASGSVETIALDDVEMDSTVVVDTAVLEFDGPEKGHRPWLRISGTLSGLHPHQQLPFGVEELTFGTDSPTQMDYRYDFTPEQLSELVSAKGLYSGDAAVTERAVGIEWELPGRADLLMIVPEDVEQPPTVFVEIHDQNSHTIDQESSGYELIEYFVDCEVEGETAVREAEAARAAARERSDAIHDIFANERLDEQQALHSSSRSTGDLDFEDEDEFDLEQDQPQDETEQESGSFAQKLGEVQAHREAAIEAMRERIHSMEPERIEAVYAGRMSSMVDSAMAQARGEQSEQDEDEKSTVSEPGRARRRLMAQIAEEDRRQEQEQEQAKPERRAGDLDLGDL